MHLSKDKKIYFASDFHLGVPSHKESRERENRIVAWLEVVQNDAKVIYLVGDIFDFWFEYKHAIPKGFTRFFGKIAALTDAGIEVVFFTGNHDMWMFDYLEKELGVKVIREKIEIEINGKHFLIAHGDGLGPGDRGYKIIKAVFANKVCQWMFARLHPNFGIGLANYFSKTSRKHSVNEDKYLGREKEWLVQYSLKMLEKKHFDFFIFGHRHFPITVQLSDKSQYINLGEWISHNSYLEFDGEKCVMSYFSAN
ncbi:MAG: UDP-2,3-diacylglucosamine diphosphatase [Flavobacteriales bacterium]